MRIPLGIGDGRPVLRLERPVGGLLRIGLALMRRLPLVLSWSGVRGH
jgi:hypothetical protein